MQVYARQFAQHLQGNLQPIYLIFGDDDFLRLRALRQLRKRAAELQFNEREAFNTQDNFHWDQLLNSSQSLSLFSDRRVLEIELPTAAPGQDGSQALQRWVEQLPPDTLLVLHGPKLKSEQQRSKWFKALTTQGVFVPVYTPDATQFGQFIHQLAAEYNWQPDSAAVELLSRWFEGNLLALDQTLHKLALHHGSTEQASSQALSAEMIAADADISSRFDVFALEDSIHKQDVAAYLHRLKRLLDTDGEPAIIHWLLQREANTLHRLYTAMQQGSSLSQAMQDARIWKQQQSLYPARVNAWSPQHSEQAFHLLWMAEHSLKRDNGADLPTLFSHLGLLLARPQALPPDWLLDAPVYHDQH